MQANDTARKIAHALLDIGAIHVQPQAPIRFKSGILSPIYIDNRHLIFHPSAWQMVIEGFEQLIHELALNVDVIAGVAVGGVPHSAALAYALQKPSVFIRKQSKDYGAKKLVEGGDVAGWQVLLVEDLVTTGGSSLQAAQHVSNAGGMVETILAIVSYGFAVADAAFADANISLHTLTNFNAIMTVAKEREQFAPEDIAVVEAWLDNPIDWEHRR